MDGLFRVLAAVDTGKDKNIVTYTKTSIVSADWYKQLGTPTSGGGIFPLYNRRKYDTLPNLARVFLSAGAIA